ncbi:MAG: amidohydrolase family protein [Gemmatimonadetes bacterium]|nr:amidohydrolase family protein [Gemmatimonadota bacterium]
MSPQQSCFTRAVTRVREGATLVSALSFLACTPAPTYDVVLAGGRVMDPASGTDATLHVGIIGDTIAALSTEPLAGKDTVDVTGLVVAPGFIDLHAHGQTEGDMQLQARDGVTTALDMEAGVFPVAPWYAAMEGKVPLNFGATVGHRPARYNVFHDGVEIGHGPTNPRPILALGPLPRGANQAATGVQIAALETAMAQGLDEGGLGLGFGINYSPGATQEEIERLFAVAAGRRVPVFVHTRAFGVEPIREVVRAAAKSRTALHVVHVASSSLGDLPLSLALLDSARAAGMDVTTEAYPYTAGSTRLESAMFNPGWQDNLRVDYGDLAWPQTGERLTKESFERYRKQGGWVVIHMMKEENVDKAIAHPGVMIASDGVPYVNGTGHPRGVGTYARVLGHYVREQQSLTLMDALSRMTILPARRLESFVPQMAKRGRVARGAFADLTVFDPAKVVDRATFTEPALTSVGIPHVLVNGAFVVRDGALVAGARPGRAIRVPPKKP